MDLFSRVPRAYGELIGHACSLIPRATLELVEPRFLCGVDPAFVDLHHYTRSPGYDEISHACYPYHLLARPRADRQSTIVLPRICPPEDVIHEIGHLVHEALGFDFTPPETTDYSNVNSHEAFAEAFQYAVAPPNAAWAAYIASEDFRPFLAAARLSG